MDLAKKYLIIAVVGIVSLFLYDGGVSGHCHSLGEVFDAKCGCGYSKIFYLGGGKLDFKTFCGFPFFCNACESLYQENYLDKDKHCRSCGSNDVKPFSEMCIDKTGEEIFGWYAGDLKISLPEGNYYCPSCKEYLLKFENAGWWD